MPRALGWNAVLAWLLTWMLPLWRCFLHLGLAHVDLVEQAVVAIFGRLEGRGGVAAGVEGDDSAAMALRLRLHDWRW